MKSVSRLAVFLPVPLMTLLAMWWDRSIHDVASNPKPWERVLAGTIWSASLVAILVVPVVLSVVRKAWHGGLPPLLVCFAVVLASALYASGATIWGWPRPPELFNSDMELFGGVYVVAAVAFSFALYDTALSFRAGLGLRAMGAGAITIVCGAVVAASSYLMVFVE